MSQLSSLLEKDTKTTKEGGKRGPACLHWCIFGHNLFRQNLSAASYSYIKPYPAFYKASDWLLEIERYSLDILNSYLIYYNMLMVSRYLTLLRLGLIHLWFVNQNPAISLKFSCVLYSCMNNLQIQLNDQAVLLPLLLLSFIKTFCLDMKVWQLLRQITSPHS